MDLAGITVIVMAPHGQEFIVQVPHLHREVRVRVPVTDDPAAGPAPSAPTASITPARARAGAMAGFEYAAPTPAAAASPEPRLVERVYLYCGIDRVGHTGEGMTVRVPLFTLDGIPIPTEMRRPNEVWGYGGGPLDDKDSWES